MCPARWRIVLERQQWTHALMLPVGKKPRRSTSALIRVQALPGIPPLLSLRDGTVNRFALLSGPSCVECHGSLTHRAGPSAVDTAPSCCPVGKKPRPCNIRACQCASVRPVPAPLSLRDSRATVRKRRGCMHRLAGASCWAVSGRCTSSAPAGRRGHAR